MGRRYNLGAQLALAVAIILSNCPTAAASGGKGDGVELRWQPTNVFNGSPIVFRVVALERMKSISGAWLEHELAFSFDEQSKTWYALAGVSLETLAGSYPLKLRAETASGKSVSVEKLLTVRKGKYPRIKASVPTKFTAPNPEELKEIDADRELKKDVFAKVNPEREWSGAFVAPVSARISDVFGTARIFNGKVARVHQGLDFAVPKGTPVAALNRGTVLLARPLFYEGTCVMLDHGQGLLSIYMHLSEVKVKEGDTVTKGQIVGLSGGTGQSTGPHLHIAVRWQGIYVNPATLFSLKLPGS